MQCSWLPGQICLHNNLLCVSGSLNFTYLFKSCAVTVQVLAHVQHYMSSCCRSRDKSIRRWSPTSGLTRMNTMVRNQTTMMGESPVAIKVTGVDDYHSPQRVKWMQAHMTAGEREKMIPLRNLQADSPSSQSSSPRMWRVGENFVRRCQASESFLPFFYSFPFPSLPLPYYFLLSQPFHHHHHKLY